MGCGMAEDESWVEARSSRVSGVRVLILGKTSPVESYPAGAKRNNSDTNKKAKKLLVPGPHGPTYTAQDKLWWLQGWARTPPSTFQWMLWADMRGQGLIMGPLVSCFPSRTPQEELSSLLTFPAQPRNVNRGGGLLWGILESPPLPIKQMSPLASVDVEV